MNLVCLVILDGWGIAPPGPGNAVELADTPVFDALWDRYPHATLRASGEAVGLPAGQMGNSEVGHLTIGSGRILLQDLARVNEAILDGSLGRNEALAAAFARARERGGDVHLLGLVSYGGVHSHIEHLRALLALAESEGMADRTWIHAFTDGRDVSPHAAASDLAELPVDRIATVCGRYYAMDRDSRWDRTDRAFEAIVNGEGAHADDPVAAVHASYAGGVTDEFVEPVVLDGRPRLGRNDAAIFFNFRPDRARQLSQRLLEAGFDLTTMTRYRADFPFPVAFDEREVRNTLAEVISAHGFRQLHAAETEKYAHVTYFFNGGEEKEWTGETRILVPSPRDVASYDLKPEMSIDEVATRFCRGAGRLRVRGRQLRESGHGGTYGLDPGGRRGGRGRRPCARPGGRVRARGRRCLSGDRGPRQCRDDARARRSEPAHSAHDEPRASDRHERGFRLPFGGGTS